MARRTLFEQTHRIETPRALRALGAKLVDVVYPRRCAGCGRRGAWVCAACDAALPRFAAPWCDRCGVPIESGPCRCADLPPTIDRLRTAARFDGWLREAIIAFKYRDEWARAHHLALVLAPAFDDLSGVDALVPVPLHARRLRQRGYNQSALLARATAAAVGLPVDEALLRIRHTPQQVGLAAADRRANVAGAFALCPGVETCGRQFVLIDDVLTTGSTVAACAAALRAGGATGVSAVALARER